MSMQSLAKHEQIESLQGIRAIAFIAIFLSHIGIPQFGGLGPWGVSVFLIMSGFLLTINHFSETDHSIKECYTFAKTRVKRLYPLHVLMLILSIPLSVGFIKQVGLIKSLGIFVLDSVLLQAFVPNSLVYFSFNYVSWYLSVCVFAYFFFPIILQKIKRSNHSKFSILFLLLIQLLLAFLSSLVPIDTFGSNSFFKWFIYIFPPMRFIDFCLGCEIGIIYKTTRIHCNSEECRTSWIVLFIFVCIVVSAICYYIVFPQKEELSHPEMWWTYSCLFSALNCGLIYFISLDNSFFSRLLSTKKSVLHSVDKTGEID